MKRIKILFVAAAYAIMLCSCVTIDPGQEPESMPEQVSESVVEIVSEEPEVNREEKNPLDETFECRPEMLEADWSDCLIQIDNTIFRDDHSMSLNEAITALQNSGVEYKITVYRMKADGTEHEIIEYNPDIPIEGEESVRFKVYKGDEKYFSIEASNTSKEPIMAGDPAMIVDGVEAEHDSFYRNLYFCKGLRGDGGGLTHEEVKAVFAADGINVQEDRVFRKDRRTGERVSVTQGSISPSLSGENVKGEMYGYTYTYYVCNEDGICIDVGIYSEVLE